MTTIAGEAPPISILVLIDDENRIKRHKYNFQHAVVEVPPELTTSDTATKSLGKKMIKAIVKPTISHIASAYNELEVSQVFVTLTFSKSITKPSALTRIQSRDDSDTAGAKKTKEKSKTGMAVGVAKSAGFVSAVFLGKVALLPFKSQSSPHTIKIFYTVKLTSTSCLLYG